MNITTGKGSCAGLEQRRSEHQGARARKRLRHFVAHHKAAIVSFFLLLLMCVNMLTIISRKSLTNDEFYHIPAGYYHLTEGNFQINSEHPPLVKMLAALPLLSLRLITEPPQQDEPAETPITRGHTAFAKFWMDNTLTFERISFLARLPMIALTLGALVFVYTKQSFGSRAAVFAVALFSFEPNILAHGRIVQTDVPAAFGYLLFFYTLENYLTAPTLRRALAVGSAIGLALVTKFSLLIVIPIFIASMIWLLRRGQHKNLSHRQFVVRVAAALGSAVFITNAAYYFKNQSLAADTRWLAAEFGGRFDALMTGSRTLARILPSSFLYGILMLLAHNQQGNFAALLGSYSDKGWWYYFPVAFALKTTIPFLLLSVAAMVWTTWEAFRKRVLRFVLPLCAALMYMIVSMMSNINIGIRHLLPIFPFLFVLGGALLDRVLRVHVRRVMCAFAVALLLCWTVVACARAYPDYVPYMNELAWQHPHWYYLSDSNVEWGDDVRELAEYLRARGETRVDAALLGGWLTLTHYKIEYVALDNLANLQSSAPSQDFHYVAIGASFLNGSTIPPVIMEDESSSIKQYRPNLFAAYRNITPEKVFGNSIYLYRVRP